MATTGAAWHISNPDAPKPWAWFDPDSRRAIPFDFSEYLADIESTYASHETFVQEGLVVASEMQASGVVIVTIESAGDSPGLVLNERYFVTVRLTSADGQVQDQTLFLRMREM